MKTSIITITLLSLALTGCTTTPLGTINDNGTGYTVDKEACQRLGIDYDSVDRHERGHLAGLYHCSDRNCLMYKTIYPGEIKTKLCMMCLLKSKGVLSANNK